MEGDELEGKNGDRLLVEEIEREQLEEAVAVYNFEVSDFHTYFVGTCCILVHNTCRKEPDRIAREMNYRKTNAYSHGQPVYFNSKAPRALRYITIDYDSHNGGYWKAASSVEELAKKSTRSGTYDMYLKKRIGG